MVARANEPNLILASQSPRRRYLLEQAGLTFSVIPSLFDEDSVQLTNPESRWSSTLPKPKRMKLPKTSGCWVIGADTIVTIGDSILGKPGNPAEARQMLKSSADKPIVYIPDLPSSAKKNKSPSADSAKPM
jgi:septum formation protein